MKYIWRVLGFGYPLRHYLPEYIIYTILYTVFGLVNFAMLIPMMNTLFNIQKTQIVSPPEVSWSVGYLVDAVNYYIYYVSTTYGKMTTLVMICLTILVANLISGVFKYMAIKTVQRLRTNILRRIREALYSKIIHQSFYFHGKKRRGELYSTLLGEVPQIDGSVVSAIRSWMTDGVTLITYFCYLFYVSYQLTLLTLFILPVGGYFISKFVKKMRTVGKEVLLSGQKMNNFVDETLNGVRIIQSHAATDFFDKKFGQVSDENAFVCKKNDLKRDLSSPVSEFLGISMVMLILCFGGFFIFNEQSGLSSAAFLSYLIVYSQAINPLKGLSNSISNVQRGMVACEHVFDMLDEDILVKNVPTPVVKHSFEKAIVFDNVSFSYGAGRYALQNFNLTIPRGTSVALVGASGSGKTTISYLLNRFIDPAEGAIYMDGVNIKDIDLDCLRRMMAYIPQEPFLFNESIASNIAFGYEEINEENIDKALHIAYADTFVNKLPQKKHSIVGERGMTLSGGERQRIAIARAVYKDCPIYILDEATSALDSKSERFVQKAIEKITKTKTSLMIAHRLSTVKNVDMVVVMREGKIIEKGTHEKLAAKKKGYYASLVAIQTLH